MPQNPLAATTSINPSNQQAPSRVDVTKNLLIGKGGAAVYNITVATVIKAAPGRVAKVIVQVAGSGTGTVNNCITTGAAAVGNQVCVIPETVGPLDIDWPCDTGITVVPGTGQTVAISYT